MNRFWSIIHLFSRKVREEFNVCWSNREKKNVSEVKKREKLGNKGERR